MNIRKYSFLFLFSCSTVFSSSNILAHACIPTEPLLIDLGGDGIELSEKGVGVSFDITGTGIPVEIQWVKQGGNEAFLFRDLNGNELADSGKEFFGDSTPLYDGSGNKALNGFHALGQFDSPILGGDDNGVINNADIVWEELYLWLDKNADGISTPDEVSKVAGSIVVEIPTIPKERKNNFVDAAGNLMPFEAKATGIKTHANGETTKKKLDVVDVYFHLLNV
ncbi:hypothetical protein [Microbulbifer sediminum]|uniref:hypothetical protein n=1 Tax=Microbulbifer sediminum TaxID=2904250 RepID=UPI001F31C5BA|nr:hypothetical protein [Microbulbifer sediminum]